MAKYKKKRGCISTFLLLPFYVMYLGFVLCGSFLLGIFSFLWGIITLPFTRHRKMTGYEYEHKAADYLRRKGYWGVKVTQASGDYGIDITAHKGKKKYAVQCKYYSSPVGIAAVQQAYAGKSHYNCTDAMVITNNTFTQAAKTLAAENKVKLLANVK